MPKPGENATYRKGYSMIRIETMYHQLLCKIAEENGISLKDLSHYVWASFLVDEKAVSKAVSICVDRKKAKELSAIQDEIDRLEKKKEEIEEQYSQVLQST